MGPRPWGGAGPRDSRERRCGAEQRRGRHGEEEGAAKWAMAVSGRGNGSRGGERVTRGPAWSGKERARAGTERRRHVGRDVTGVWGRWVGWRALARARPLGR